MMMEEERTIGIGLSHMKNGLFSWKSFLKGLVSGSLLAGGIINPFGAVSVLLFIIGVYVFIDSVIPFGEQLYPVLTVSGFILGCIFAFVFSFASLGLAYTALVIIITILMYITKVSKRFRQV